MPKYTPTPDDLYETKPCFVCGRDVLDEGAETCSHLCEQLKQNFDDDWEWFLWKDYEGEEDDF
ncbi:MAG: hypothetical protein GY841_15940 [FCB group bacterium]|nr:hypothetical protein [FCB group bacterium]